MIGLNSMETCFLAALPLYLRVVSARGDETSVQYAAAAVARKWRMVGVRVQRMGDGSLVWVRQSKYAGR
jgi:hypothetical protein